MISYGPDIFDQNIIEDKRILNTVAISSHSNFLCTITCGENSSYLNLSQNNVNGEKLVSYQVTIFIVP